VHLYPKPKHGLIIEPFAGSARYALKYFDRDVILIDKFWQIVDVWKFLQQASENDILSLPVLSAGESLKDEKFNSLIAAEKLLIGFQIARGNYWSVNKPQKFNSWESDKIEIAKQLYKIRHWEIKLGDYHDSPAAEATWFIDPPYFQGGLKYKFGSDLLNFDELKVWILSRKGQIIACENAAAEWMPFKYLASHNGSVKRQHEVFWTNEKVEHQALLFG
jgi:site-specific DNA-adenine methylase